MYPFRSRWRWLFVGQWGHLLEALDRTRGRRGRQLKARTDALRLWSRVRTVVMILLSVGLVATVVASLSSIIPGGEAATLAAKQFAATTGSATGLLSLVYLFLTRLLGQIETDIWALLVIEKEPSG